jgi:histidine triad (HIT) family protein
MPVMSCVFCRIVAGTEPSQTIHEDEHAIAFRNLAQATRGHALVVPRAQGLALKEGIGSRTRSRAVRLR